MSRLRDRAFLLEAFAFSNLGFLAVDIYVAHLANHFANAFEWIPVIYSSTVPLLLLPGLFMRSGVNGPVGRPLGLFVGGSAIAVGLTGMLLHLNSSFISGQSLHDLVYAAPFVAPLAYAGVGFLILLNRLVKQDSLEWGQWLLFLATGGWISNFGLSLLDHAQNGFFYTREWLPVAGSAYAVAFLFWATVSTPRRSFLSLCMKLMALEIGVGCVGTYFHLAPALSNTAAPLSDRFIYGAPVFAPLLFPNLALVALIGLWHLFTLAEPQPQTAQPDAL